MILLESCLLLLVNALVIFGVWFTVRPGEIFSIPASYADVLPEFITKPMYDCVYCMSSVWGSLVFWLYYDHTARSLACWPFYCLALCGLNRLLVAAFPKILETE